MQKSYIVALSFLIGGLNMGDEVGSSRTETNTFDLGRFLEQDSRSNITRANSILNSAGLTACTECINFTPFVTVNDEAIRPTINGQRQDVSKIKVGLCKLGLTPRPVYVYFSSVDALSEEKGSDTVSVKVNSFKGANSSCQNMVLVQEAVLKEAGRTAEEFATAVTRAEKIGNVNVDIPGIVTGIHENFRSNKRQQV